MVNLLVEGVRTCNHQPGCDVLEDQEGPLEERSVMIGLLDKVQHENRISPWERTLLIPFPGYTGQVPRPRTASTLVEGNAHKVQIAVTDNAEFSTALPNGYQTDRYFIHIIKKLRDGGSRGLARCFR